MNHSFLILVFCCALIVPVFAEKPFPSEVIAADQLTTKETHAAKLPKALQKVLLEQEVFADASGQLLEVLQVGEWDLNGDGRPEFFVHDPASYTGGRMTYVFAKNGDQFTRLGGFLGIEYLAAPVNGYHQIVTFSRAGGGVCIRELHEFENGEYRSVRGAEYAFDNSGKERYLREVKN